MSRMNNRGDGGGYHPQNLMQQGIPQQQGIPLGPNPNADQLALHLKMQQHQLQINQQNQMANSQLRQSQQSLTAQQKQQLRAQMMQQRQSQQQRRTSSSTTAAAAAVATAASSGGRQSLSLTKPPDLLKPPTAQKKQSEARADPSATTTTGAASTTPKTSSSTNRRDSSSTTSTLTVPTEQIAALLSKCNWSDRTIYLSRLLLGGGSVNGFLRSTATVQRIKKQRARQLKKPQPDATTATAAADPTGATGKDSQTKEEELKKEAMNPKIAKKIRSELVAGLEFCKSLHGTIQSVLSELDPSSRAVPLMESNPVATGIKSAPAAGTRFLSPAAPQQQRTTTKQSSTTNKMGVPSTTASPGDPTGSTLRKIRKNKLRPLPPPAIPDVDSSGKKLPKREMTWRVFELHRYRALNADDVVAAKVSSRDLWILARVLKPYPAANLPPKDFLQLSESKKESLFREKVIIKDVEDKDNGKYTVARAMILPLPRIYQEAADWASWYCRKGTRVYAMYPMTTSLYSGTVIDSTTYCRGDDDIIVVEFDGDEPDATTGKMPQYHIPGRFVTLIPREFPAAATTKKRKRESTTSLPSKRGKQQQQGKSKGPRDDSALNSMLDQMVAYGDVNADLDDFDLGFGDL